MLFVCTDLLQANCFLIYVPYPSKVKKNIGYKFLIPPGSRVVSSLVTIVTKVNKWNNLYISFVLPSVFIRPVDSLKHQAWMPGPNGVVYMVNNNKLAWEDAKQFCEKRSGKLAIITNEHVRDSLKDLLRNQERALYWTGMLTVISEVTNGGERALFYKEVKS